MKRKYALVTGSSSGLGFEISNYLLEKNYVVFGASRSETEIDHEDFYDLDVDVRDEESVMGMFDVIEGECQGLNLIVSNAGVFEMGPVCDYDSELFLDHLKTNVQGPFHILKHAHSFLIENTTHIVHLGSIAGKQGIENVSAYCASKFALNGLIESCEKEWKPLGVRFSTLNPGAIDTPIWEGINEDFESAKMLDPEDFIHVFEMVIDSPINMQFKDVTFLHKSGVLE